MKIIEIIESKHWLNTKTGQTASIYGAVPYANDISKQDWQIVVRGYTWRLSNGSVGLGRIPAKTYAEALQVMNNFNNR
jgi:hypothetical protein